MIGVKLNGVHVDVLKYAEETVILAESTEDLQLLLEIIAESR